MESDELAAVKRILERERKARKTAEKLLEAKSFELYAANRELKTLASNLEQLVEERTKESEESRLAAEAALRVKGEFLASVSHEIRTPLNGIIGMNNLLSEEPLSSRQYQYVESVNDSAHILLNLINDILDFSKVEAGKLEIEITEFSLSQVIDRAIDVLRGKAGILSIDFNEICSPNLPDRLRGDPSRLQQVLINLLDNAIKFTTEGEVTLRVDRLNTGSSDVEIAFVVRDTGIGMSDETMQELFKPFTQANQDTTRKFGGTGLGLAIVKNLVELMGGSISVDSMEGRGSVFEVRLTFESVEDRKSRELPFDKSFSCILTLENPLLEESLTATFSSLGVTKLKVVPWSEWPCHFSESEKSLWVVSMEGDTKSIGRLKEGLKQLPSMVKPLVLTKAVGVLSGKLGSETEILSLPVNRKQLVKRVGSLMGIGGEIVTKSEMDSGALLGVDLSGLNILLAEDNVVNQRVSTEMLLKLGARVDVAANGYEVIHMLQIIPYDLILMDIRMPEMGGIEACQRIRAQGMDIPIVALTASAMTGDRERFLQAGMNDYLSKPLLIESLVDVMARQLDGIQVNKTDEVPNSGMPTDSSVMDLDSFMVSLGGDREMAMEVIQEFCSQYVELEKKGFEYLDEGQYSEAASLFHKLSGGASAIRAMELANAALGIEETLVRDVEDDGKLKEDSVMLKTAIARFTQFAKKNKWTTDS